MRLWVAWVCKVCAVSVVRKVSVVTGGYTVVHGTSVCHRLNVNSVSFLEVK